MGAAAWALWKCLRSSVFGGFKFTVTSKYMHFSTIRILAVVGLLLVSLNANSATVSAAQGLINISTRGQIQTGDNVLIGGFVISGSAQSVLIRAAGPSLSAYGVSGVLANPTMQLYSGQTVLATNDNWVDAANVNLIQATGLAPTNTLESAILMLLQPGAYTVVVSGVGGSTGVGIVEVFNLPGAATPNVAPVANAGVNQNVSLSQLVTLDGSSSADADANPITYSWSLLSIPSGSQAALSSNSYSPITTFVADLPGTYIAKLVVNDNRVDSDPASVSITAATTPAYTVISLPAQNAGKVISGDFDGDGRVDIMAGSNGGVGLQAPQGYFYQQGSDGSFIRSALDSSNNPKQLAGDINHDGRADFLSTDSNGSCSLIVKFGAPNLQFSNGGSVELGTCGGAQLWMGDFNGDSITDFVSLSYSPAIALGNANGGFGRSFPALPYVYQGATVAIGDVDADGVKDMVAINPSFGTNQFLLSIASGAGAGTYNNISNFVQSKFGLTSSSSQFFARLIDVSNDGHKDVIYFPGGSQIFTLVASAPGKFDIPAKLFETGSQIWSAEIADINNDGNVDVAAATTNGLMLLLGDGLGGWSAPIFPLGKARATSYLPSVAINDVNGDGRPDVIFGAGPTIYLLVQKQ